MMGRQHGARALVLLLLCASARRGVHAQGAPGTITSVAGAAGCGYLTVDPAGNVYFVGGDVHKIAAGTGRITTVAGTGTPGYTGTAA
jgi:hypothetical protein